MRTITFPAFLGLALLVAAMPAAAAEPGAGEGESAEALDLALPQSALAGYRNDPPGTWYGDTSGVPSQPERPLVVRRPACPTSPDGEETDITGSVEAGVGYSKRGGNSNWQAATINYCKEYATDDGGSRTMNLQLNIGTYDGPHGFHGPYGPGPGWGPYPLSAPGPRPAGR